MYTSSLRLKKNADAPVYCWSVFQIQLKPRANVLKLSQQQLVLIHSHSKLGLLGKSQCPFSCMRPQRKDKKDPYRQRHPKQAPEAGSFFWPAPDSMQLSWFSRMAWDSPAPGLAAAAWGKADPIRPCWSPAQTILCFAQLLLPCISLKQGRFWRAKDRLSTTSCCTRKEAGRLETVIIATPLYLGHCCSFLSRKQMGRWGNCGDKLRRWEFLEPWKKRRDSWKAEESYKNMEE